MSPLKIELLLRLYSLPFPLAGYPESQKNAPPVRQAFADFREAELLREPVTHAVTVFNDSAGIPFRVCALSKKGLALVQRLMEIEPISEPSQSPG